MKYWDTSALLPLLVSEKTSDRMRALHADDPAVVTWWATPVECASMFAKVAREHSVSAAAMSSSMARLRAAAGTWTHVVPSADVREHAYRLLRVHSLRAGDALQLAAAVVASGFQPSALEFVTLDERQGEAAEKEGFRVVA